MSYTKGKLTAVDKRVDQGMGNSCSLGYVVINDKGQEVCLCKELADAKRIVRCVNNYDKIDLLLQQLTPQGSEFANEPERCFEYAKGQIDEGHQAKKDVVKARRKIDGLVDLLKDILEWDGILPHSKVRIEQALANEKGDL